MVIGKVNYFMVAPCFDDVKSTVASQMHWHRPAGCARKRTERFMWTKTTEHCYRACVIEYFS